MAPAIEPTDQLLRDACARMTARFRWADDYETVMQDRVRSRLVRIAAKHPTAAGLTQARTQRQPACRPSQPPLGGLPLFDRKRAAAGERDDD
jgi:anti-sigma factor RsiW